MHKPVVMHRTRTELELFFILMPIYSKQTQAHVIVHVITIKYTYVSIIT